MGNCIQTMLLRKGTFSCNGKQESEGVESYAKVDPVPLFISLPCKGKPENLVSPPFSPKSSAEAMSNRTTVKIVVSKKQLEKLVKNAKELEANGAAVRFAETFWEQERRAKCKWCPSLATITE